MSFEEYLIQSNKEKVLKSLGASYSWYLRLLTPNGQMLNRIPYEFNPITGELMNGTCLNKDMENIYYMTVFKRFTSRTEFDEVIGNGIKTFLGFVLHNNFNALKGHEMMHFDSGKLGEPATIVQNALLILCLFGECSISCLPCSKDELIIKLADAIVAQQKEDGSFNYYFGDGIASQGNEACSEVLLALTHAYQHSLNAKYLKAVERAIKNYEKMFTEGKVHGSLLSNAVSWQIQAIAEIGTLAPNNLELIQYAFSVFDTIIKSCYFTEICNRPQRFTTEEIASVLKGLTESYSLLLQLEKCDFSQNSDGVQFYNELQTRKHHYRNSIAIAASFLLGLQNSILKEGLQHAFGGYCHGFRRHFRLQRLDVTGKSVHAFIKLYQVLERIEGHNCLPEFIEIVPTESDPLIQKR